ncbi:putative pre-mRNA-splicing factor [Clavispora lusitaniae]|uniref:Pre-mRNA-splicing factor CEF1 n=1 Tax=Clavispora lusitaniae TaxID=36911 RepID=A0AA91PXB3_CLALS|nr:putative pre-mRNA-splicing factor [Clavispora lusitaniae]
MAPPIYVKGGVWTNVEDQILKAAKTAKQAKARWNEYLNPLINRTDWTKEEDEKLLSLAKLMPNQWRSISPIMGRTATQCVERYQKLLEEAVKGEDSDRSDDEDLKLTGPGIETLPALGNAFESLPSRPDLEDMDDDEREMLSEAKARLANTQGKKAKRKDRERMLEESKRISLLQKRRELKAAGIKVSLESKNRKKRQAFDYNADIPHEHTPLPGLFDTTEEEQRTEKEALSFEKTVNTKGMAMSDVEKSNKRKAEELVKRESNKSLKEIKGAAEASTLAAEEDLKRRKLNIPAPGEKETTRNIEERIKLKSKDIIESQKTNSNIFTSPAASHEVPRQIDFEPHKMTQRIPKKKLVELISKSLARLPKTTKRVQLVLPQLDSHEDLVTAELEEDSTNKAEALKLLQRVEEEKAKLRRSQVVQREYHIPNPKTLVLPSEDGLSDIEKEIATEFHALIKSDYKEFVDSSASGNIVHILEEEEYNTIKDLISKECKDQEHVMKQLLERSTNLPHTTDAMDRVYDLIQELSSRAEAYEFPIMDSWNRYYEEVRSQIEGINEKYENLSQLDIETRLYTSIADQETEAIKWRTARLKKTMEDISRAETRTLKKRDSLY